MAKRSFTIFFFNVRIYFSFVVVMDAFDLGAVGGLNKEGAAWALGWGADTGLLGRICVVLSKTC